HGTACHVAGANEITRAIEDALHIKIGDTTPDRAFTLETVSCLGCCSLAPVVMIDSTTHGNVDDRGVTRAIAKARRTDSGAQPCE
ncbi:MAG: NAD(P)H-dependent oxidoreductase subunit E, partial [Acidobacteria bacterium]|nr:NAD(P)H-dependent oxidoreductase subunit E [Acidobacteriota bacterium]